MKANTPIDRLAIQVQQNLFEYFYYHNKKQLEASFRSPKSFQEINKDVNSDKLLTMISMNTNESKDVSIPNYSHDIQKHREEVGTK